MEAYIDASASSYVSTDKDTNFYTGDGVVMNHVFNIKNFNEGEPNYLLLLDKDTNKIESRWFVIDWDKIRGGQYAASLRRDLLADNYEAITKAPCFIEKGYVGPEDSAIFNKEDMTFNQIKTSEKILRDDSKTAWIVGYIAQDHPALSNKQFTLNPEVDMTITGNFSDWEYANWCDGTSHTTIDESNINNIVRYVLRAQTIREFQFNSSSSKSFDSLADDSWNISSTGSKTAQQVLNDYISSNWMGNIYWSTVLDKIYLDNSSYANSTVMSTLNSVIGKKVQFSDGVYEFFMVSSNNSTGWKYWNSGNLYTYLYSTVLADLQELNGSISAVTRYPVAYNLNTISFIINARKIDNIQGAYTYSISQSARKLEDAPYKMFCMPYYTGSGRYTFSLDGSTYIYVDKDIQMGWAMSIAKELGDSLYDLQILPYCPLSNWRGRSSSSGIWSVDKTVDVDYAVLKGANNSTYGYCSFCDVSSKEQFLTYPIEVMDYKIENECDMYRLCSPNYASVFEFSAAKNGGVEGYNIRYTYKPYQPFINVAPKFNRLYGKDFKDNRGLILAGDFSLPIVRDAWINYQLQNKNYQLAFDRQIENMEVGFKQQNTQAVWGAITGTLQGGVSGAAAGGMMTGSPVGAVIGGVVGTVGSAAGGIADITMQREMQREAVDFSRDNFGFQLGNIKALPNTLNKVSSIVANSKLFPFLEYYTCTNEEKQALNDKLKYNGMTIGRIGKIEDFLHPDAQTYVKGQLIRLEGNYDAHTANEIANEFMKGWYI